MRRSVPALAFLLFAACGGDQPAAPATAYKADAHTQGAIARMEAAVAAAKLTADSADVEPFHQLGTALQAEIDQLISGCTMTGPDHDQLHVWLEQLLPQVQTLGKAEGIAALRSAQQAVVAALAAFHAQFPAPK